MDLSQIFLFDGISQDECNSMLECFNVRRKHFIKGEIICDFTIPNNSIYILNEGRAELIREDIDGNHTVLEYLDKKSVFGETLAFSRIGNEYVFVVCNENCEIIFIDYDQITKRCSKACLHHTKLVENLFTLISQKALVLSERVEILSMRTIRGKLMCYFSIMTNKYGGKQFKLPFSMSDLAGYICVDRSAMTREIKKMKEEGLLDINNRRVEIKNLLKTVK